MATQTGTRMRAEDRRQHILDAATRSFARTGFTGTSTDAIAREAGVSQPYVVRMFGTKQELFLEVFDRAARRVADAFEAVLAAGDFDPGSEEDRARLGAAYTDLLGDRDLMLVMLHGFAAGDSPEIGEQARGCMAGIYDQLRRSGIEADDVRDFIAHGMLLTVLMAMRAPDHLAGSEALRELVGCAFGDDVSLVVPPGVNRAGRGPRGSGPPPRRARRGSSSMSRRRCSRSRRRTSIWSRRYCSCPASPGCSSYMLTIVAISSSEKPSRRPRRISASRTRSRLWKTRTVPRRSGESRPRSS